MMQEATYVGCGAYELHLGAAGYLCRECAAGAQEHVDAVLITEVEGPAYCDSCGDMIIGPAVTGPDAVALPLIDSDLLGEDGFAERCEPILITWPTATCEDGRQIRLRPSDLAAAYGYHAGPIDDGEYLAVIDDRWVAIDYYGHIAVLAVD